MRYGRSSLSESRAIEAPHIVDDMPSRRTIGVDMGGTKLLADAVGFGIPALVDRRSGRVATSVHLPLRDVPFADLISERLDVPVFVDNDANLAALAEHRHGAARGAHDAVVLTLGTGIGG